MLPKSVIISHKSNNCNLWEVITFVGDTPTPSFTVCFSNNPTRHNLSSGQRTWMAERDYRVTNHKCMVPMALVSAMM